MTINKLQEIDRWNYQWQKFREDISFKPNLKVADEVIKLFNGNLKGLKILEVGAGSGSDCITLVEQKAKCYALDFSTKALITCQYLTNKKNVKIKRILADCQHIPFANDFFDLVFSVGLVEHFKNPISVLKEQLRVIKKGGYLLIDVPQKYNPYTVVKHIRMHFNIHPFGWETEYSQKDLEKLAAKLNLKLIRIYGRDSVFIGRFPKKIDHCWRKVSAIIEASKIAPYISLCIGAIYKK